jgi:hypothetical protein
MQALIQLLDLDGNPTGYLGLEANKTPKRVYYSGFWYVPEEELPEPSYPARQQGFTRSFLYREEK